MLTVRGLTKAYGDLEALRGVSFTVREGDILGFLGPNGAGKSTTMRIITGYLSATAGQVTVDGIDAIANSPAVRRRIGYLPEHTPLYLDQRVAEFLSYRAWLKGVPRRERKSRVAEVMEQTLITERARQVIGNLSKGFRQRVGIADALIGRPRLLILDEPTIGLDPNQIRQVRELIRELAAHRTVILSTHILAEVEMICSRVVVIHRGRTIAEDSIEGLIAAHDDNAIRLAFRREGFDVKAATGVLSELAGVRSVRALDHALDHAPAGELRLRLLCEADADPREALVSLAGDKGWPLLELAREHLSLEDVFSRLTTAADAGELETPAAAASPASPEETDGKVDAARGDAAKADDAAKAENDTSETSAEADDDSKADNAKADNAGVDESKADDAKAEKDAAADDAKAENAAEADDARAEKDAGAEEESDVKAGADKAAGASEEGA